MCLWNNINCHEDKMIGRKMEGFPLFNISEIEKLFNQNESLVNNSGNTSHGVSQDTQRELNYENIVTSFICCVGVAGNISNIAVLRMRKTQVGLDQIGRSALLGLLALACSDLLFCIIGVFSGLLLTIATGEVTSGSDTQKNIAIVGFAVELYRGACINVILFISTWCITMLSLERYIVVMHPFRARQHVNSQFILISRIVIILLSVLINFPLFIRFKMHFLVCPDDQNSTCIYPIPRTNAIQKPLMMFHWISWASIGTFLPLVILLFTNVKLVREVMRLKKRQLRNRKGKAIFNVTKTLIVIAVSFVILVVPSMLLDFLDVHHLVERGYSFHLAVKLTNICQAIKFSCNFLLYCTVNRTFRQNIC